MTEFEIRKVIENYKLSEAPIEVKEKAIKKLETMLHSSTELAMQQFIESQPDLPDVEGN